MAALNLRFRQPVPLRFLCLPALALLGSLAPLPGVTAPLPLLSQGCGPMANYPARVVTSQPLSRVFLRQTPDSSTWNNVVDSVPRNRVGLINRLEDGGDGSLWAQVEFPYGGHGFRSGWMRADYLQGLQCGVQARAR